jgi:carbon-monoxide dehydrogenase large subunit
VLAVYEARDDTLTVWSSTQEPHQLREHLAAAMGMANEGVRVVAPDGGGGFGQKSSMFPEEFSTPYLARLLGRPVKWIEDRQENMLAFHGRGYTVDMDAAVAEDGTLLGMRARIVADLGAYFLMSTPSIPLLAEHRIAGHYKTPAMKVDVFGAFTNKPPTGAYRGAGGPESAYCVERRPST